MQYKVVVSLKIHLIMDHLRAIHFLITYSKRERLAVLQIFYLYSPNIEAGYKSKQTSGVDAQKIAANFFLDFLYVVVQCCCLMNEIARYRIHRPGNRGSNIHQICLLETYIFFNEMKKGSSLLLQHI